MPIVFKDVHYILLLGAEKLGGRGEAKGTAKLSLKGGFNDLPRLARLGPYDEVGVCRLPINRGGDAAIVQATEVDVKECQ